MSRILALVTGLLLGLAWLYPTTLLSAGLGWLGAIAVVMILRQTPRLWPLYCAGVIVQILGFSWLLETIRAFGGFPLFVAVPIFALFVFLSALQFLIVPFVYRALPATLDYFSLRAPCAWLCGEMLAVRIFPWYLGHTQLSVAPIAQWAAFIGAPGISFLMVWLIEATLTSRSSPRRRGSLLILPVVVALVLSAQARMSHLDTESPNIPVSVVQGNLSIAQKGDMSYFDENLGAYVTLTESEPVANRLIIWPESVFTQFLSSQNTTVAADPRLSFWQPGTNLLFGALTFESRERYFNSAVAIHADGSMSPPYHKQILMPFGEYTPLGSWLPWLADINSTAANFTPGNGMVLLEFPNIKGLKVAPLICYEDIVSGIGRTAIQAGAELLVNLTNDAWFGRSVAALQHHQIASFRAIETGRYLVRSTNTGFTAVVSPTGKTSASLENWSPGVLRTNVAARTEVTFFVRYAVDLVLFWLAVVVGIVSVARALLSVPQKAH